MFNNSTTSSSEFKTGVTSIELWIILVFFYVILCGIFCTLGYALVSLIIIREKKFHGRFFIIICFLAICRGLFCLQILIIGLYRILRTLKLVPGILTKAQCHAVHFWLVIGITLEIILLLILVIERILAIVFPSIYRQRLKSGNRSIIILCIIIYLLIILIKLPLSYAGINLSEPQPCVNSFTAPTELFNVISTNIDLTILITIIVLYLLLMIYIRKRIGSSTNEAVLKNQLKLMPVLRNLVLTHGSFMLISKIFRTVAGLVHDEEISARFSSYGAVFATIDSLLNLMTLIFSNDELKQACLPKNICIFCCKNTRIGVVSNSKVISESVMNTIVTTLTLPVYHIGLGVDK